MAVNLLQEILRAARRILASFNPEKAQQRVDMAVWMWGYSSVVEHLTADQEVPGSNPGAP